MRIIWHKMVSNETSLCRQGIEGNCFLQGPAPLRSARMEAVPFFWEGGDELQTVLFPYPDVYQRQDKPGAVRSGMGIEAERTGAD